MSNALFITLKSNRILLNNINKIDVRCINKFFKINISFNNDILVDKYVKNNYGKYYICKYPDYIIDNVNYLLPAYNIDCLKNFDEVCKDIDILKKISDNIVIDPIIKNAIKKNSINGKVMFS